MGLVLLYLFGVTLWAAIMYALCNLFLTRSGEPRLFGEDRGVDGVFVGTLAGLLAKRSQAKSAATGASVSQRARASAAASRPAPDHPPAHSPSRAAANPARIRPRQVAATSEAPTSLC